MWEKGNPSALLVEMQTGVVPVEKSMEFELPFNLAIPLLGLYPKNLKTLVKKNLCTPMFIAALFTIAKCLKQPKCPSVNECIKNCGTLHNGILHSKKKEVTPTFLNSINGTGEYYAK